MLIWRSLSPGTLAAVLGHIAGQHKDDPSALDDRGAEIALSTSPTGRGPADATILSLMSDRKAG